MDQYAAYFGYAVLGCSVAHKIIAALRPVAKETKSDADDKALDAVEKAVNAIEHIVGALSIFKKSK